MAVIKSPANPEVFREMTPEDGWLLGLLWADGCLTEARRGSGIWRITFVSTDEELARLVAGMVGAPSRRTSDRRPDRKPCYRVSLGHPQVVARACALGLTARKSGSCLFPLLPSSVLPSFVRGYFDGDGGVFFYKNRTVVDPDWPPRLISTVIGSRPFIGTWQSLLEGYAAITPKKPNCKGQVVSVNYNHGDSLRLADFMYADGGPSLGRKRHAFEQGRAQPPLRTWRSG